MTWITPHAAVSEYGVRVACGARVIDRAEVEALRLKMMSERREACDGCD
ncbi:hypothetical protein [Alkalilimnicola ehrlichii]